MNEQIFKTILEGVLEQARIPFDSIKSKLNEFADERFPFLQ